MVASRRRRSKVGPVAAKTVDRGVVRRFRRTFFHDGGTHDLRKGGGKAFEEAMPSGGGGGAKGTSGRKEWWCGSPKRKGWSKRNGALERMERSLDQFVGQWCCQPAVTIGIPRAG